ncbi:response regulator [Bacteroides sp. 51]|nr:response regulator [Bacteroides sp. 51]
MSPDGGFYYDGVKAIEQDENGFVWIMMDYELYRFDGFEYKRFYPYFAAISDTTRWVFDTMASDSYGNLYVNTDNGIYSYTPITDTFKRLSDKVSDIQIDKNSNIWVRKNSKWGLLEKDGTFDEPLVDGDSVAFMNTNICIYNSEVYAFIRHKIYRYNPAKHEFTICQSLPNDDSGIVQAYAHQGKLWVNTDKYGLYKIDLSTFQIEDYYGLIPEVNNNTRRRNLFIDKRGNLWFITINGLYILNPQNQKLTHYTHSETDPFSLPNNSIWCINDDRQGNVWLGTYSGKICYININESHAFKSYTPQNSELNHVLASSFAEDRKYLWVGTEGGGINRIDKETGSYFHLTINNGLSYNNVKSMVVDNHQNLWIGMFKGGLDYYQPKTNAIHHFQNIKDNPNSLLVNDIRKVILDNDLGLWIAYQHYKPQISYFSFDTQTFEHINLIEDNSDSFIFDILKQGEKYLWVITNKHLYRVDTKDKQVEKMALNGAIYMGLYTFCLDDSGNIWIGTIANGLIKFDTNTSSFVFLKDYISNTIYSIYSICYDNEIIWMGTDDGLYAYNITQNNLQKFDKREGTQGQVYYPLAVMKGQDNKLYFGGTNGFTIVEPREISRNRYNPKVIISDFYIDHKSVHADYTLKDSLPVITLDYDQSNFGFRFSSDNYHIPEKNLFKYRLLGYDENWIETTASNRTAMYSKVPAGTYSFEVYTANNDGIWGDTPSVFKIIRKPAPWFSWPAYVVYFLIVISIAFIIIRYYIEKKRLKMQLYLEAIEKDKQEQIHQTQLRFFTNISHDFRTPLSLIIAALDKLRKEGLKEYYYRILNGNAQRLLNLVNELMDFRTVENGKMKLSLEPININNFITEIAADFTDYAEQRNIDFKVKCDIRLPNDIYLDKNVLGKVVMNLLNNAFKYSPEKGCITIEIRSGAEKYVSKYGNSYKIGDVSGYETFSMIVSDTGVGISKESISSVFERFYKVNTVNTDSHLGTGIGLALVKSLVLLHKGSITIYSERNCGTDFVIDLPVDSTIFAESDFKVEKEDINYQTENEEIINAEEMGENILTSTKKKILIAEDNEDLRTLIVESLSDDFNTFQAPDGLDASKLIAEIDFDLIISDIMMPHKDGVSLCNDVKKDIHTSHIPFILLTAKTSLESRIEGVDSGADLYFEKPIDLDYLRLSIHNIFKNQQLLKEHYAKNYYADSSELSSNEQDNKFLKHITDFLERNLDQSEMDVNLIASELSMSRSKLYTKVKKLTGKSVVEFVLNYRLRKAARLIIEENMTMREIMMQIGIESQPYFTNSFKKMFGETPTSFAAKHKKKK